MKLWENILHHIVINNIIYKYIIMKITICIPCVDKHIPLFEKLMDSMVYYTRKPDEVIVSISPKFLKLNLVNEKNRLEQKYNNLFVIIQDKITNCALNLNNCFEYVTGDIIIIAGADDIIHPQKCEIMEKLFTEYPDTKMILHNLYNSKSRDYSLKIFENVTLENIKLYKNINSIENGIGCSNIEYEKDTGKIFGHNYVCGAPSIHKDCIKKFKFQNINYAEDAMYVANINYFFKKTIYIDLKLMSYYSSGSWK